MPFLLHSPSSTSVFSTTNTLIVATLQKLNWKAKEIPDEPDSIELTELVVQSCIAETSEGEVRIDENILRGPHTANQLSKRLNDIWGIENAEVKYVGELARKNVEGKEDVGKNGWGYLESSPLNLRNED